MKLFVSVAIFFSVWIGTIFLSSPIKSISMREVAVRECFRMMS